MQAIYKGKPLVEGERIPGTALTFVRPILPRRGEFLCDCGRSVGIDICYFDQGKRKSCGCGCYKKLEEIK